MLRKTSILISLSTIQRYITLAHEMVHLRQVITDGVVDENSISTRKNTP